MFQYSLTDTFHCASSGRITVVKLNRIIYHHVAIFSVLAKGILNGSEMKQQQKWKHNSVPCLTANAGPLKVQSVFLICILVLNFSFRNVILLGLPSIIQKLWLKRYILVCFYFHAERSSVWNNLQKEIKMLKKSDPVDVTKCIYFKLSSCKDEIQQREDSCLRGKGTSAGASGGNTWILCVMLCFYWAVIIGHWKARCQNWTGNTFFFPFLWEFSDKNIFCIEVSENNAEFCKKKYFPFSPSLFSKRVLE